MNESKTLFNRKVLNFQKTVWNTNYGILNLCITTIKRNINFFLIVLIIPTKISDIKTFIKLLPETSPADHFILKQNITKQKQKYSDEELTILKIYVNDCFTGFNGILIFALKPVSEHIASPVAHIKNTRILRQKFVKKMEKSCNMSHTENERT